MERDTFEAIVLMVGAGLGAGIVPGLYVPRARIQDMRVLPFGDRTLTRELGIVTRRQEKRNELIELLHQTLARVRLSKMDD
jgi:DNA-binding transcriptional LysR family regulator